MLTISSNLSFPKSLLLLMLSMECMKKLHSYWHASIMVFQSSLAVVPPVDQIQHKLYSGIWQKCKRIDYCSNVEKSWGKDMDFQKFQFQRVVKRLEYENGGFQLCILLKYRRWLKTRKSRENPRFEDVMVHWEQHALSPELMVLWRRLKSLGWLELITSFLPKNKERHDFLFKWMWSDKQSMCHANRANKYKMQQNNFYCIYIFDLAMFTYSSKHNWFISVSSDFINRYVRHIWCQSCFHCLLSHPKEFFFQCFDFVSRITREFVTHSSFRLLFCVTKTTAPIIYF